jgi:hypothetical protein
LLPLSLPPSLVFENFCLQKFQFSQLGSRALGCAENKTQKTKKEKEKVGFVLL